MTAVTQHGRSTICSSEEVPVVPSLTTAAVTFNKYILLCFSKYWERAHHKIAVPTGVTAIYVAPQAAFGIKHRRLIQQLVQQH